MAKKPFSLRYIEYITSPQWKQRRKLALIQANYKCQLCHDTNRLQVHHNDYTRLGAERDDDLVVLCTPCHHGVTRMLRWRKMWKKLINVIMPSLTKN
jgi:5-methylcytosine-specific restriction endonuclease McrA